MKKNAPIKKTHEDATDISDLIDRYGFWRSGVQVRVSLNSYVNIKRNYGRHNNQIGTILRQAKRDDKGYIRYAVSFEDGTVLLVYAFDIHPLDSVGDIPINPSKRKS